MPNSPIIAVEQLTKYYGPKPGIENISFTVTRGEIFGFLGPNGAGKTTTIRLLLDLTRASSGTIHIFGQPIPKNSLWVRQKCGYLPGNFSAYAHITGAEFLRFVANMRGASSDGQPSLLDRFGLSKKDLSQKIKHLSHGTRQKLGIVQAFFHQPQLLILDEPTIGLDPLMQEQFYELLRELQSDGCTIFFSSHNLAEVEKVCHRVAIIRQGQLVALETLESLKKKRYRRLQLTLRAPVEHLQLAKAQLLNKQGLRYDFLVKGDIRTLLKSLSNLPLADFVFPEPDLEQVFMTYYRSEENE